MPSLEVVVDQIRHEERQLREIVPAALEAAVGRSDDQGCDAMLQAIISPVPASQLTDSK